MSLCNQAPGQTSLFVALALVEILFGAIGLKLVAGFFGFGATEFHPVFGRALLFVSPSLSLAKLVEIDRLSQA